MTKSRSPQAASGPRIPFHRVAACLPRLRSTFYGLLIFPFCLLTPAFAGTHVTGVYAVGSSPAVMATVNGNPEYGLVFAQRNKSITYNDVLYVNNVVTAYFDLNGNLNDGSGNAWIDLVSDANSTPDDSYYVVTINIQGAVHSEIWIVPDEASVNVLSVRQTVAPPSGGTSNPVFFYQTVQQSGAALAQRPTLNLAGTGVSCLDNSGLQRTDCTITGGSGTGTVLSFSAGDLSPLFTTSVATATSTPALSFTLNAVTQNAFLAGSSAGGTAAPTFRALAGSDLPTPSASTLGGIKSWNPAPHTWLNGILSTGTPTATQPACADLSDSAVSCSTDATNASNISTGTLAAARLPNPSAAALGGIESLASVSHKWINTISTSGVPGATQPDYSDLTGTPTLPATLANASHKWLNSYTSSTGLFTQTQPDYSDLTGTPTLFYETVKQDGTSQTQRPTLNLISGANATVTCADNSGASRTDCTIAASASSGMGNPMTTLGDIIYENSTPAAARLAGQTSTTKEYLSQTGNGTISATPAWAQVACSDLSNAATSCSTDATNASNISSGTLGAARLPNPSASTLGGIESLASVSHKWINAISTSGVPSAAQPDYSDLTGVPSTFTPSAHNLLSASHGDTTTHTVVRGDIIAGIGSSASWAAVAKGGTNAYPKWNSSGDVVASTGAASGTGACPAHQWTSTLIADAAPTCTQPTAADLAAQPTFDVILNPAANVSFTAPATDTYSFLGTAPGSVSGTGTSAGTTFTFTSPGGGATTGSATTAGAGGDFSLSTGAGGSGSGGTNANGGRGGNFALVLGAGGAKSGSGTVGANGVGSVEQDGISTTPTDAWFLKNTTASASGTAVQYSPSLHYGAHVWNTTATAADNWVDWISLAIPTSGTAPTSKLSWRSSLSTTSTPSYTERMTLSDGGNLSVTGQYQVGGAQIACANLSNAAASCSIDATNASNISGGTLGAARLPNPSATTLGGIESLAPVTSKWINAISTSGVPGATQPNFTDLAGSLALGQTPLTARGDLLVANSTPVLARLALGTNGQCLTSNGSDAVWGSCAAGSGITTLNTLTAATQTFSTGTSGTDFNISSATSTHTFNIPDAGASARGLVTTGSQSFAGVKTFTSPPSFSVASEPGNAVNFKDTGTTNWAISLGSETTPYLYIGGPTVTSQYFWRANWNSTSDPANTFRSASAGAGQVVLSADGAPSQTGDLQEWRSSTPTVLAKVDSSGNGTFPLVNATTGFRVNGAASSTNVLVGNGTNFVGGQVNSTQVDTTISGYSSVNTSSNAMSIAATDTKLVEFSLASGYLNNANQVVGVRAGGTWTTGTSQTPTWNFKIKLCTVSGCGSGTVVTLCSWTSAASTASTTETWITSCDVGTTTTGSSGAVIAHGLADLPAGSTGNLTAAMLNDANTAASSAINLTAALFLDVMANVSTQSGTKNSCTYHTARLTP